jgi:hypothetical protein
VVQFDHELGGDGITLTLRETEERFLLGAASSLRSAEAFLRSNPGA